MVWTPVDRRTEEPAGPALDEHVLARIGELANRYSTKRAALLPALHLAQEHAGYLPDKAIAQIADLLDIPPVHVLDVVSFYEMFHRQPTGAKLLQVCESFCCELMGQPRLLDAIRQRLGIKPGETTPDGRFTLMAVQCLAACDKAPVMLVNDQLHEHVTAEKLDEILK